MDPQIIKTKLVVLYPYEDTDNALFAKKNAIDTVYLNKHRGVDFSIVGKLKKEIDTFMPDVIQTHLYVVAYVLLAAPLKIKKYHTVHNVAEKEAFGFRRIINKIAFKFGNFIPVAISPYCAKTIEDVYGIQLKNIPCIMNGVDTSKFVVSPIQHEGTVFINVGRLQSQKNHILLINAFAKVLGKDPTVRLTIHDAVEAGFNHVVFIIRKDIEKEFKEVIGDRIASICSSHNVTVDYAFQNINDIPGILPEGRTKPWGTGQAVLAAKNVIDTPFIVINADDYYGKEGFKAVHKYLVNGGKSCMAGFVLKNTLSDNGGVTRGICKMDENGNLTEVVETKSIVKTANGAEADGVVVDVNSLVSMNMWGLTPDFLDVLEEGFKEFFEKEVPGNPLKAEYLIPIFIGELLEQGKMSVKVLKTNDTWYGMTYHEDVAAVKDSFKKMLENGVYKADLFSDL